MDALLVAMLGGLVGLGLVVVTAGVRGVRLLSDRQTPGRRGSQGDLALRAGAGLLCGVAAWWLTSWPAAGLAAAVGGWWLPTAVRARGRHQRELELVEAIAGWSEQLRDTLAAANGLEHAIGATAHLAPAPIAPALGRLAARVDFESLPDALRRFADEVDHPLADFVVAALVTAAEREARELGALLTHLAACARDEAQMRTRVWVGRARTRSAVRIIIGVVVLFVGALVLLDREYLDPYDTASGQLALAVILGVFAVSFVGMERLGRLELPDRFVRRRGSEAG
jgi:Flp pilus assembly protein TadB